MRICGAKKIDSERGRDVKERARKRKKERERERKVLNRFF